MRRRAVVILSTLVLAIRSAGSLGAQTTVSLGGEIVHVEDETVVLVGARGTTGASGELGMDFGLQVVPEWLAEGGLGMIGNVGLGFNVPFGERTVLIPRAGAMMLMLVGSGGGGGIPGVEAGMALVATTAEGRGIRFDLTHRRLGDGGVFGVAMGIAWRRGE